VHNLHRWPLFLVALVCLGPACNESSTSGSSPDPDIRTIAQPTTGPYVSVAVDNHFHDIHPADNREIAKDRPFVVRNEGRNLHNVTIVGTDISEDIKPGESFRIDPVGKLGPPGAYEVICKYHGSEGMTGEFTIVR
jgi:hypothetical protein